MEVYEIRKGMHLGPIRRDIRVGSIIEWNPETALLKIDGTRIPETPQDKTQEAMRMLFTLRDRNPEDSPIVPYVSPEEKSKLPLPDKTVVSYLWPWYAALNAVQKRFGVNHHDAEWTPSNEAQENYLEFFGLYDVSKYENLFTVEIEEDANMLRIHSKMTYKPKWKYKGTLEPSTVAEAVVFEHGMSCASEPKVHPYPVTSVLGKGGVRVMFTPIDNLPDIDMESDEYNVFVSIANASSVRRVIGDYRQVKIPTVKISQSSDLEWAKGLSLKGRTIASLVCTIDFEFDDEGDRLGYNSDKTYATTGTTYNMVNPDLPYLMWVDAGADIPIFQALIRSDTWSNASL